jgi:hypothetical protein
LEKIDISIPYYLYYLDMVNPYGNYLGTKVRRGHGIGGAGRGQGRKSNVERELRAQAEEEQQMYQDEERTARAARERERVEQTRKDIEYAYERNRDLAVKVYESGR